MFRNYFKIAIRHLWKNRLYSLLNLLGLSVALTAVILAILYYHDERSFDTFHQNIPNLYRINTIYIDNNTGAKETSGGTGQVQGPAFKNQLPEIVQYARVFGGDIMENVKSGNKGLNLATAFVDSTFFNVLSFPMLYGNPATALNSKQSIVITEKTALKFFGTADVVGKTLEVADTPDSLFAMFNITGVVKNPPPNSSVQFDVLIPFSYLQIMFDDTNWLNAYLNTFVVLHPQANIKNLEKKFTAIHNIHAREQLAVAKQNREFDKQTYYSLQPITDMHLQPLYAPPTSREGGFAHDTKAAYSYFLLGIAIFILLMASINFINLSIANSLKRAKEIGVRKINGSGRLQVIFQFLIESSIICCTAMLLAIFLTQSLLPFFNELSGKQMTFSSAANVTLLGSLIALLIANILLSGFYPAVVLSAFKPVNVLYGKQTLSGRNWLGKILVVFQFSLSACLIISSIVYYRQMNFMQTKELGYNPDNIIRVEIPPRRDGKAIYSYFKNELAKEPGISQIALEASFGGGYKMNLQDKSIESSFKLVEESYIPMLNLTVKQGRNFSSSFGTDKKEAAIVNEAFVRTARLNNPIGQQIRTGDWFENRVVTIVGVVKDYHYGSLKHAIQPMVFAMADETQGIMLFKISKAKHKHALAAIEKAFKAAVPGAEYSYVFWDDLNAKEYNHEKRWQQIIAIATILSIVISCLGLFGLSNLSTHRRTKEIGVRKVLGASATSITALLSKDFLKLVIAGFIIAAPISWWIMHHWLQDFPYRIEMSAWLLLAAAVFIILISLSTVCLQAIKAALANPVKSLRTE